MLYLATEIFLVCHYYSLVKYAKKKPSYTVNYIFNCGYLRSLGTSEVQLRVSSLERVCSQATVRLENQSRLFSSTGY